MLMAGEELNVQIVREGKEPGQGVGYLDDGTMIVVDSGDALLICPRERAEGVRQVVDWLKQTGRDQYLVNTPC